jgi:PKD repeat protein
LIYVRHKPRADFNAGTVCEGNKTAFTNLSDTDSITIESWLWRFGDGELSEHQGDIKHPYLTPGRYTAQLSISSANGCSDSLAREVVVGSIPNAKIGLDFGFTELCTGDSTGLSVEYDANYHYQWKTGGVNLTNDTVYYLVIKNKGDFSVDITNRIADCRVTSDEVSVQMLESPQIFTIIAGSDTNICQGESVHLGVPYNASYTYLWKHNGSILSDVSSHSYVAEKEGSYSVDVSVGSCKTTSRSKQIVYKPGLPKPKLLTFGPAFWYFVCDIEDAGTYRWYYNGSVVKETTSNTYWAGNILGEYHVEVNDGGECLCHRKR